MLSLIREKACNLALQVMNIGIQVQTKEGELVIHNTSKAALRLGGDFHLIVDGSLEITSDNGVSFLTQNGMICLDSLDKERPFIHFNSRMASQIRDLPESKMYRDHIQNVIAERQSDRSCGHTDSELVEMVSSLMDRVKQLEERR